MLSFLSLRPLILRSQINIGIKDIFECFMIVLNYQRAEC